MLKILNLSFIALLSLLVVDLTAQIPLKRVQEIGNQFPIATEIAIAVIQNGEITYHGFIKTKEGYKAKKNHQAVFEIGSISKVFTATILAHKVYNGKLKLEMPVKKLLQHKLKGNPQISLLTLANHTSGLPRLPENILSLIQKDPYNPYKNYDAAKLKDYCKTMLHADHVPGTTYAYSNLGAGLLGHALAVKSKQSYETLLQTLVFQPFDMASTTTNRALVNDRLVKGLSPIGVEVPNWDLNVLAPAGGILSSVEDLAKFAQANFNTAHQFLTLQRQVTHTIDEQSSIALGWHISDKQYHWHNGATGGYRSFMTLNVASKTAVIVLSNLGPAHPKSGNIDVLAMKWMKDLHKKN